MSKLPRHEIAQAILARIADANDTRTLSQEIAAYLIEQGRESDLESIMRDVMRLQRNAGLLEADVRVAHSVDTALLAEVVELIKREFDDSDTVIVDQTVDPNIVGGMRIVTASEQLDMSVRGKLDTFKRLTHEGTAL